MKHDTSLTAALVATAVSLADQAVVCDIECEGVRQLEPDGTTWYDFRPLIDEREHSPEACDMAAEAIAYGIARGVLELHSVRIHLVRILRPRRADHLALSTPTV